MITSYSTLKTSIANYLHRSDLTDLIPEFIADGEARIYNDLRIRAMETAFSGTTSGGTIALPSGFLEWIYLYADGDSNQKLERRDMEWIVTNYPSATGTPIYFARDGEYLKFGPFPDADTDLVGRYYKRLDALSDSNTTNWFTSNAPELLRFAALCEAAPYIGNDARIPVWEGKYAAVKQRLKMTERNEQFSGSRLTTRPA